MRYALGHRSSPFHRFGAICGVLNASRIITIDIYHQTFHQMTLIQSPVSSRDWLSRRGVLAAKGARPATVWRQLIASERPTRSNCVS